MLTAPQPSTWSRLQATRAMGNPFASNPLAAPLAPPHGLMSSSDAASLPSPESDREGSDGGAGAAPEDSATHGGRLARPWQSARTGRLTGGASSGLQSPTRSTASSSTQLHTSAAARTRYAKLHFWAAKGIIPGDLCCEGVQGVPQVSEGGLQLCAQLLRCQEGKGTSRTL